MDIVFVAAEVAPWTKTGGLGDVMAALPVALAARGHRVMVVTPRYFLSDKSEEQYTSAGIKSTGVHTVRNSTHQLGSSSTNNAALNLPPLYLLLPSIFCLSICCCSQSSASLSVAALKLLPL